MAALTLPAVLVFPSVAAAQADFQVLGAAGNSAVFLAPGTAGGTSELMLGEDPAGNFGFKIFYDGATNELQFLGHTTGGDQGPWLTIGRDTGLVTIHGTLTGDSPDPPCFNTTTRFVDCGNGTVTDTVTGLIWVKNAGCLAWQNWANANTIVMSIAAGLCGLDDGSKPGDWRLPTKEEWAAMVAPSCDTEPLLVGNDTEPGGGCHSDHPWATDVQFAYWSSRAQLGLPDRGVSASLFAGAGFVAFVPKDTVLPLWPVRPAH